MVGLSGGWTGRGSEKPVDAAKVGAADRAMAQAVRDEFRAAIRGAMHVGGDVWADRVLEQQANERRSACGRKVA